MIKLRYSQSQNISPKINQAQNQKPRTKTFPALKLITTPKQEPITRFTPLRTITNPFDPIKPPPSDPTPTPPFNLPNFKFNKKRKTTEKQGFNVFVKSKGKFQQVNKGFSLSKAGALSLGGSITDKTVSATFLIKPSNLKIRSSSSSFSKNSNKFKLSKFGNVIKGVEKNKFRISTAGEKSGITLKGLLSKKKKKKKSKFKYF